MDDGSTFKDRLGFIRKLDEPLADLLHRAAQLAHDDPASAAVALRCFAERLVRTYLCPERLLRRPLFEILDDLRQQQALVVRVLDQLDDLRKAGNGGAHPNSRPPTVDKALAWLRTAWDVAAWLHSEKGGRAEDVPSYEAPTPADGNSVFREAFLGGPDGLGDPAAKFHVAMAIKAQDEQRLRELRDGKHWSVPSRVKETVELLRYATYDVPAARTEIAKINLEKRDPTSDEVEEALELLRWAVNDNDPEGLFYLAAIHLDGLHGVEVDIPKAVELLEQALTHEDPRAFNALAMLYRDGRGVERNPERARSYAERSARAGFPIGQHQFAGFLLDGFGGEANREAGLVWLRRAVRQDWPLAKFHLATLILDGEAEPAPGEEPEALLEEACRDRCQEALLWRAGRELDKPNDQADFYKAFSDLLAAVEALAGADKEEVLSKIRAAHQRLETYLLCLPVRSQRRMRLAGLWFQINPDGSRKFSSPGEDGEQMFSFDKTESGDPKMTDKSIMNMVMMHAGPGRSKGEIDKMFRLAKTAMNQEGELREALPPVAKAGRNESCPCGSGKKYKKCHGK